MANVSIRPYALKREKGSWINSDPINLLFLNCGIGDIDRKLRSKDGWNVVSVSDDLFVDGIKQDYQLSLGSTWKRFHVRFWNHADSAVLASAHYETFRLRGHTVHHFEGAEWKIRKSFQADAPDWELADIVVNPGTEELERFNDGMTTIIMRNER